MPVFHRAYNFVRPLVPPRARPALRRLADCVDPIARATFRGAAGGPVPPSSLRRRVGSATIKMFVEDGREAAADIERALASIGRPLESHARVLDWGCGAGRTAMHFIGRDGVELHGCDVDAQAIDWLRRNVPGDPDRFQVSRFTPPLPYPDDHFDAIYSISLFTHFSEADQMTWLRELRRVLAPGGVAVLTVAGEHALANMWWERAGDDVAERLQPLTGHIDELGFVFVPYSDVDDDPEKFPGVEGSYGLAYQSEEFTRRRWAEVFGVLGFIGAGLNDFQDIVLVGDQQVSASALPSTASIIGSVNLPVNVFCWLG